MDNGGIKDPLISGGFFIVAVVPVSFCMYTFWTSFVGENLRTIAINQALISLAGLVVFLSLNEIFTENFINIPILIFIIGIISQLIQPNGFKYFIGGLGVTFGLILFVGATLFELPPKTVLLLSGPAVILSLAFAIYQNYKIKTIAKTNR